MWVLLSRVWGDLDVGSLTSTDISARREADSSDPPNENFVKTFVNIYKKRVREKTTGIVKQRGAGTIP